MFERHTTAAAAPGPVRQIANWHLLERIGQGGMAEVWRGAPASLGAGAPTVAIKLQAQRLVGDERFTRMFRREAQIGQLLRHRNIVRVLAEGEQHGRGYLVMEHVEGTTLAKLQPALARVPDETLRVQLAVHIAVQLLEALAYAHGIGTDAGHPAGIVHRDVSPHNVLISLAGEVKLADWGVSHLARAAMMASATRCLLGKPRYMAPDHLGGRHRDRRIDLYAVGAVLQELLDGTPFRGDVPTAEILPDAIAGVRPPLQRPVPEPIARALDDLLAPDPERRTPSAEVALAALRRWPGTRDMREVLARLVRGSVAPRRAMRLPPTQLLSPTQPAWVQPIDDDDDDVTRLFAARARELPCTRVFLPAHRGPASTPATARIASAPTPVTVPAATALFVPAWSMPAPASRPRRRRRRGFALTAAIVAVISAVSVASGAVLAAAVTAPSGASP
ncbi:MAG: protein kinase [Nannocystaceae bacterium]|nr:protein kinase [Nannocystaceae bacterium]